MRSLLTPPLCIAHFRVAGDETSNASAISSSTTRFRRKRPSEPFAVVVLAAVLLGGLACAQNPPAPAPDPDPIRFFPGNNWVLIGARAPGGEARSMIIIDGVITAIEDRVMPATSDSDRRLPMVHVGSRFLVPALVDSHVHFRFNDAREEFAAAGFGAAVDLAAPRSFLDETTSQRRATKIRVLASGPMVTSTGGYPTQSWGRDGYGLQARDEAAARAIVIGLINDGAAVIKIAMDGDRGLSDGQIRGVIEVAHARGAKVVAHALSDHEANRAGTLGVDVLAHIPTERLSDETISLWRERTVISTLSAFDGDAVENLSRLHEAGTAVLYGTDFGNTRVAGVSAVEIVMLARAGLGPPDILASLTSAPAQAWGLAGLEVGAPASFLLLDADPLEDPLELARPNAVVLDGHAIRVNGRP